MNAYIHHAYGEGEPVYGWLITTYRPGELDFFAHYAVRKPNGDLIDVTPPVFGYRSRQTYFAEAKDQETFSIKKGIVLKDFDQTFCMKNGTKRDKGNIEIRYFQRDSALPKSWSVFEETTGWKRPEKAEKDDSVWRFNRG